MTNWRTVFEGVGILAVVASLVFVGIQLRQEQTIARSELGAGSFEYFAMINEAQIDPEFSVVYEKMLRAPEKLSDEEMIRANAFLLLTTDFLARECYLKERGIFSECENAIRDIVKRYFGNRYAQAWWNATDTRPNIELPEWIEREIKNTPVDREVDDLEEIRKILEKGI